MSRSFPGAAQHEAQRNDALQTRDRYGLSFGEDRCIWRSRISDAPLAVTRADSLDAVQLALHRIRDTVLRG
jgi:hypothetical protein